MKNRRILSLMLTAMLLFSLAACGGSDQAANESYKSEATGGSVSENTSADMEMPMEPELGFDKPESEAAGGEILKDRKIIYTYDAHLQTLEFENTLIQLEQAIAAAGGYVESSSRSGSGAIDYGRVYARDAHYTLRIPADAAGDFVKGLSAYAAVTNSSKGTDDVTEYYYDSEARINNLRVQEKRLLELLAEAENISDVLTIEQKLSEVRYEIESLDGTIRRLDSQIEFSRVSLYIEEVFDRTQLQEAPMTLWERITSEFSYSIRVIRDTLEDWLVFLIGDSLLILFWGIVLFVLWQVFKKIRSKRGERKPLFKLSFRRKKNADEDPENKQE